MMEVKLQNQWHLGEWSVWVYERTSGGVRVLTPSLRDWVDSPMGALPEPTLTLPAGVLEALVAAGNAEAGVKPPNTSQAEHLADSIMVRDRLLALVEGKWKQR